MSDKIIIVGAGVIGAALAMTLQDSGHEVLLIDRDAPCSGASFGNAGGIVNGSCIPTAMPGALFQGMKMLGDPLSPLSIKPAYMHKILPWLLRFTWQSRQSAVQHNAASIYAMSRFAASSWKQLTDNTPLAKWLTESGWLKVYETDKSYSGMENAIKLMDKFGTKYETINAAQIHDLEPNLAPIYKHGIFQKDSLTISNPEKLVQAMVALFVNRGGKYQQFAVDQINTDNTQVELSGVSGQLTADRVVLATGAWSKSLAKQLGDSVPLDTERGYHIMFSESTRSLLNRPVVNGEHSFVLCPMTSGLRMTSQVEFAGLAAKPNYARIRNLLPAAKRMLLSVDTQEQSIWMGRRPSLPDSLPVIGFSKKSKKVIYAFGHQHLGMTLAAITAYMVADLVNNQQPRVATNPYNPNRFKIL